MITNKRFIIFIVFVVIVIGIGVFIKNNFKEDKSMDNKVISNGENKLYYLGHASIRIVTSEGKVIYIDPYMGDDYDLSADLVLVTHEHYDHNDVSKVKNKSNDFRIIRESDALVDGKYQTFDLGYVNVQAVEAGYNKFHDKSECVGYVITLSDNTRIYVAGDTTITSMMDELGSWNIDYAFLPCDGKYTMTVDVAVEASKKIGAKYTIPYHTANDGRDFDNDIADKFNVENKIIMKPGEEIVLNHG